jgi:hypothetical protein
MEKVNVIVISLTFIPPAVMWLCGLLILLLK